MKNKIIKSMVISLIINFSLFLINLICAYFFKFMPLAIEMAGGEVIEYIGFGVILNKIFAFGLIEEIGGANYEIELAPLSFVISFAFIFILIFIIMIAISKKSNSHKKK